ncbi:hypothetical protein AB0G02_10315 [Actinosynnema sp. NPDC023658]|uniref:hypothetical protein n=1 Tax=Actinosynnema sp. NPDC023658 TaxID=3155465 RepID=UPI0033DA929A
MAADDAAAAPVSLEAPVGIAAVAFGVIGLVAGLVRHRRTSSPRTAANQRVVPAVAVVDGNPAEVRPATTGV